MEKYVGTSMKVWWGQISNKDILCRYGQLREFLFNKFSYDWDISINFFRIVENEGGSSANLGTYDCSYRLNENVGRELGNDFQVGDGQVHGHRWYTYVRSSLLYWGYVDVEKVRITVTKNKNTVYLRGVPIFNCF